MHFFRATAINFRLPPFLSWRTRKRLSEFWASQKMFITGRTLEFWCYWNRNLELLRTQTLQGHSRYKHLRVILFRGSRNLKLSEFRASWKTFTLLQGHSDPNTGGGMVTHRRGLDQKWPSKQLFAKSSALADVKVFWCYTTRGHCNPGLNLEIIGKSL